MQISKHSAPSSGRPSRTGVQGIKTSFNTSVEFYTYIGGARSSSSLLCHLDHELPNTSVKTSFLRMLNTRSRFHCASSLGLLNAGAFRVGGFEVNPVVASLTIHFGRVGAWCLTMDARGFRALPLAIS